MTIKLCPFTFFKKMSLKDFGHLLSHFVFYIATDRAFAKTKRLTDISEKHVISCTLVSFQISAGAALLFISIQEKQAIVMSINFLCRGYGHYKIIFNCKSATYLSWQVARVNLQDLSICLWREYSGQKNLTCKVLTFLCI